MRYVPCVLHFENRCGLKIMEMLLVKGLSNAQGGKIVLCPEDDTVMKRENRYIKKVEDVINRQILGSEDNVPQYKVPVKKTR